MRRLTPLAIVALVAACQDATPTSPTISTPLAASAARGGPPGIIDCSTRCNRIAFDRDGMPENGGFTTIFTVNPDGTGLAQLISGAEDPAWSPNHSKIAFRYYAGGVGIAVINADGTGLKTLTLAKDDQGPRFSPDGLKIVFGRRSSKFNEINPKWSPDGKHIAFQTGVSGPNTGCIAIVTPSGGQRTELEAGGNQCSQPTWSPDSQSLAYRVEANGLSLIVQTALSNPGVAMAVTKTTYLDSAPAWVALRPRWPDGRDRFRARPSPSA